MIQQALFRPPPPRPCTPVTTRGDAPPLLRFDVDEADRAGEQRRFNCGPGALAALLQLTPDEAMDQIPGFDDKGYTSPGMMWSALRSLGVRYQRHRPRPGRGYPRIAWPRFGLVRVQWGGPWCDPGVPPRVAYMHTHWVASWSELGAVMIFDINATCAGWIPLAEWSGYLVPWLLATHHKADFTWWITDAVEVLS